MSEKSKKDLREAMQGAGISDVDLDTVAGGTCSDGQCYSSCSACCKDGSANRDGGGGDIEPFYPTP